ncbi:MAG: hypothetical protein JXR19_03425 [Bacteroidia bacterium]
MSKLLPYLFLATLFAYCTEDPTEYTHTFTSTEGINNAELIYTTVNVGTADEPAPGIYRFPLTKDDVIIPVVEEKRIFSIILIEGEMITSFEDIPAKFINMDANVEVTRNIFQSYFPEEWAPMKGSQYSSLFIQNKEDNQIFYMKTVFTGTNKEIGKHSEDY